MTGGHMKGLSPVTDGNAYTENCATMSSEPGTRPKTRLALTAKEAEQAPATVRKTAAVWEYANERYVKILKIY